ncbi:MAG TPA: hypothetical protein VNI01_09865 [Elusimicrobiota bacterium]|nr:hypothetical protein [Elusimicrobiota bacterium]
MLHVLALCALAAAPARAAEVSAKDAKAFSNAVRDYVQARSAESSDGAFHVRDASARRSWGIELVQVHTDELVRLPGGALRGCADFKSAKGVEALDVDFIARRSEDGWEVGKVILHRVDGEDRVTYDEKGRATPVEGAAGADPLAGKTLKPMTQPEDKSKRSRRGGGGGGGRSGGSGTGTFKQVGLPSLSQPASSAGSSSKAFMAIPGSSSQPQTNKQRR